MIVGEVDDPWVEVLKAFHPNGHIRQRLVVGVVVGPPRKVVRGVLTGRVVALAGQDHCSVGSAHDQGLMAAGVTRRRYEEDPWQHLGLAGELFESTPFEELGQRVVRCVACFGQLPRLDEDGSTDQLGVTSAVVEVQVAVGHMRDVADVGTGGGQRGG